MIPHRKSMMRLLTSSVGYSSEVYATTPMGFLLGICFSLRALVLLWLKCFLVM